MKVRFLVVVLAVFVIAMPVFAEDAAAVYKSKCTMCHGPDGTGQTPAGKMMKARDLSSPEVQKQKDEELETVIEKGKGKMPAYKGKIEEKTIDGLVKYIREFAKKK